MVGIIFCNNLYMCPYIYKYIDILEENGIEYEIIIWDRIGSGEESPNVISFSYKSKQLKPRGFKILDYIKFTKFLRERIKKVSYDKIIVMYTITGIICYDILTSCYKGNYLFDFRDITYEKFPLYKRIVKRLIRNSNFTCVSSEGFLKILGDSNCVIAHNFKYERLNNRKEFNENMIQKKEIKLLFIGVSRGDEFNCHIISLFGGDKRFKILFVGEGCDSKKTLNCAKLFSNITVKGIYKEREKDSFLENCDMLLYYYPPSFVNKYALANKYYDGLINYKPLISSMGTYSGERVTKAGVGLSVDFYSGNPANEIYEYYVGLDWSDYVKNVHEELDKVVSEDQIYIERTKKYLLTK